MRHRGLLAVLVGLALDEANRRGEVYFAGEPPKRPSGERTPCASGGNWQKDLANG